MNVSSYFGSLTLLSIILALPLKFVRSVFCSGYDKLWLTFLYLKRMCVLQFGGTVLYICKSGVILIHVFKLSTFLLNFCFSYQLQAEADEQLPIIIIILPISHFTSVTCCLICFEVVLLVSYKLKLLCFPEGVTIFAFTDHPPLSLIQILSLMSACL